MSYNLSIGTNINDVITLKTRIISPNSYPQRSPIISPNVFSYARITNSNTVSIPSDAEFISDSFLNTDRFRVYKKVEFDDITMLKTSLKPKIVYKDYTLTEFKSLAKSLKNNEEVQVIRL